MAASPGPWLRISQPILNVTLGMIQKGTKNFHFQFQSYPSATLRGFKISILNPQLHTKIRSLVRHVPCKLSVLCLSGPQLKCDPGYVKSSTDEFSVPGFQGQEEPLPDFPSSSFNPTLILNDSTLGLFWIFGSNEMKWLALEFCKKSFPPFK